jgi:type II secretory pathway pseudopilin PulG
MRRNTIFSRGISYIETIVWIAVFTSATIALGTSLVYYYHIAHYSIEQSSAVASVQHAIDTMVKTIREASYASDGAYPIVSLANNQIVFYAHTNAQSPYAQKVRYYVQGTALMQGVVEPSGDPPAYTNAEVVSNLIRTQYRVWRKCYRSGNSHALILQQT